MGVATLPLPSGQQEGSEASWTGQSALWYCGRLQPQQPPLTRSPPSISQGIWRIPVDEIDRPGSFAWHMNRSIVLLLKVLAQLRDHSTLLKVSSMLQRTPDQGK